MRILKSSWRHEDGAAAVEFALIAPVLLLTGLAAIDFGRAVFQDLQLSGAARAGAQYALESQAPAAIEAVTKAASGLDPALVIVNTKLFCECADGQAITCGNTCLDNGFNRTYVRVTAQAPVRALFDRNAVGLPTTLSAEATMRLQ